MSPSGRGQVLIPWPNRVQGGSYEFGGRTHQLALDEPSAGNAIHGLVRWVGWTVAEREANRVVVAQTLHAQPGYPFTLALSIEYALSSAGLTVRTSATNVGPDPCPFGSGAHPYVTVGTPSVDTALLHVPAERVLEADDHGIPTGSRAVDGTEYDFRRPRPIGATKLDTGFTGLERDANGLARVELRHPDDGSGLVLWVDEHYRYLMLYTGDDRPGCAAAQSRGRADDVPAERLQIGGRSGRPRARRLVSRSLGDRPALRHDDAAAFRRRCRAAAARHDRPQPG